MLTVSETTVSYYRGDSYPIEFTIKDKDTGDPIDITGYTFTMTISAMENPGATDTPEFFVTGVLIDALNGVVAFTPSSADNNLTPNTYYYDIQMATGSTIRTIIKQMYIITQDITKV